MARDVGDPNVLGYALTRLGHALVGAGHLAEAAEAYRDALALRRELGQSNLAMETLAGLARVSLAENDRAKAQAEVKEILDFLEAGYRLDGTDEPFRAYLTCYRVLAANEDARAPAILSQAHRLLREQAARIENNAMRRSFLENVPAHREIVAEVRN